MQQENRIEINPDIMLGKPVIRGTRVTVELILERLQSGETIDQITGSLKNITEDDVKAVIGKQKIRIKEMG